MPCITTNLLFSQLVLDGNVLELAMRYIEDILVADPVRNNENFRHAAYQQYILWQHGRLGKGNRVVLSCCVLKVRAIYPSPNGLYDHCEVRTTFNTTFNTTFKNGPH